MAGYRCDYCSGEWDTLTGKRLHDCPGGHDYGGEEPAEEVDVSDMDEEEIVDEALSAIFTCDVCGRENDPGVADGYDKGEGSPKVGVTFTFTCEHCGARNENTMSFG